MSNFMNSMNTADARTANGALTNSTSGSNCLDWFFTAGALRGKDRVAVANFNKARGENEDMAIRILLNARDIRGGAGERGTFRACLEDLIISNPAIALRVMLKVPELGRWDDLKVCFDTDLEAQAVDMILKSLVDDKNALCAKWMPRKGPVFNTLFRTAGVSPKQFRKLLVSLSDTVEQKMCAGNWAEIDFSKLPSVASARYQKSFGKNASELYGAYIEALVKGVPGVKINAGAVYPYDVVRSVRQGNATVADAQWKALPNYLEGNDENIMTVIDVSGSMGRAINGGGYSEKGVTCKDVAMSLGIYIAERSEGEFKNEFISFSTDPHFHTLTGDTLQSKLRNMERSGEDMGTDINKVFGVLLQRARRNGLTQDQLPTKLLIMSDMEFNQAGGGGWRSEKTNFEAIDAQYREAGYVRPQLVFWNIAASSGKCPVKTGDAGTALVSGCSPSIMTSLMGEELTPLAIMTEAVMKDRYNF